MTPSDPIQAAMLQVAEDMLERTVRLNARCDGLLTGLIALAVESKADMTRLKEIVDRAENQSYAERMTKISTTDRGLAGRLDRRTEHGEVLSDDIKLIRFEDEKKDS